MRVYAGGIAGYTSGSIENCYNTGGISIISEYKDMRVYAGGIAGYTLGSIENCYNIGDVNGNVNGEYGFCVGGIAPKSAVFRNNYYLNTIAITGTINNYGIEVTDEYMRTNEFYERLNIDKVWEKKLKKMYPTLDIKNIVNINSSTEITVKNTIKEFEITTEVENGIGGSISGENGECYETVIYNNSNTQDIVMNPEEGYEISKITINGEKIGYTVSNDGTYVIPAGYFSGVTEDKHIVVTYALSNQVLTIEKVDSSDSTTQIEGAVFKIEEQGDGENLYYSEEITDNNGLIKVALQPGTYTITEIQAPDDYVLDSTEHTVTMVAGSSNAITLSNRRKKKLTVHHYLKGTTSKVAEDDLDDGDVGENYTTVPHVDLEGLHLEKDSLGEYIVPANASGIFGEDNVVVTYYYELDPITLTIHHYIDGEDENFIANEYIEQTASITFNDDATYTISGEFEYDLNSNINYNNLINSYNFMYVTDNKYNELNINDNYVYNTNSEISYYYTREITTFFIEKEWTGLPDEVAINYTTELNIYENTETAEQQNSIIEKNGKRYALVEDISEFVIVGNGGILINLPKKSGEFDREYIVDETKVERNGVVLIENENYIKNIEGSKVKNTLVETLSSEKKWNDLTEEQANEYKSTFTLYKVANTTGNTIEIDGKSCVVQDVTSIEGNGTIEFTKVPIYENGIENEYILKETKIEKKIVGQDGSTSWIEISNDNINVEYIYDRSRIPEMVTNTIVTSYEIEKQWDAIDESNFKTSFTLYRAIGENNEEARDKIGRVISKSIVGSGRVKFENLPKYSDGQEIVYSVKETDVNKKDGESWKKFSLENIKIAYLESEEVDCLIKNTPIKNIHSEKKWKGLTEEQASKYKSTIVLYKSTDMTENTVEINGKNYIAYDTIILEGNETFEILDLPYYENGKEIEYILKETKVEKKVMEQDGSISWEEVNDEKLKVEYGGVKTQLADVVQIGDYVNYDASTKEISYAPADEVSGYNLARDGKVYCQGKFSSTDFMNWRVLSVDKEKGIVQLIADEPTEQMLVLSGKLGYVNGEEILDKIADVYAHGQYAEYGRSLRLKDIEQFCTITDEEMEWRKGFEKTFTTGTFIIDGKEVKATEENPVTVTNTHYYCDYRDCMNYTQLFEKGRYHLADSACEISNYDEFSYCYFGNICMNWDDRYCYSQVLAFEALGNYEITYDASVMPVITLKANLTTTGRNEEGVWQLDEPDNVIYNSIVYPYEIHYFYDGIEDTEKAEYGIENEGNVITATDNLRTGYILQSIDNNSLIISDKRENNILNVYYISKKTEYKTGKLWKGLTDEEARNYRTTLGLYKETESGLEEVKNSDGENIQKVLIGNGEVVFEDIKLYENEEIVQYSVKEVLVEKTEDGGETWKVMDESEYKSSIGRNVNAKSELVDEVQIGDYVNYNSSPETEVTYLQDFEKIGLYENFEDRSIPLEEVDDIPIDLFSFSSNEEMKWRVLNIDKDNGIVQLIADKPTQTMLSLYGLQGYKNSIELMDNASSVYAHGKYAESGRSIRMEDIDKIAGFDISQMDYSDYPEDVLRYGDTVTITSGMVVLDNGDIVEASEENPVTLTCNDYGYDPLEYIEDENVYNMLFGKHYFIANKIISHYEKWNENGYWTFDLGQGVFEMDDDWIIRAGNTFDRKNFFADSIMPVITLQANLTTTGQDENGVWQLDEPSNDIIINTLLKSYKVQKNWNIANSENYRATFKLYQTIDGVKTEVTDENTDIQIKTVDENGNNTHIISTPLGTAITVTVTGNGAIEFNNLPAYKDGSEITYSVEETLIETTKDNGTTWENVTSEFKVKHYLSTASGNTSNYDDEITNYLANRFGLNIYKFENITSNGEINEEPLENVEFNISIKNKSEIELADTSKIYKTGEDGKLLEAIYEIVIGNVSEEYTVTITEIVPYGYKQIEPIVFTVNAKLSDDGETFELTPETKTVENTQNVVITEDAILVNIKNEKNEYQITTEVVPHNEYRTNEITGKKENVSVEGGEISGQNDSVYEVVTSGNNSTREIIITPHENYAIGTVTLTSSDKAGNISTSILYDKNNPESVTQNPEITAILNQDGTMTIGTFSNIMADKNIKVEFEPIPGTVIVHHYLKGTGEEFEKEPVAIESRTGEAISDLTITNLVGEKYETSASSDIADIYELVSTSNNTTGVVVKGVTNVYYYYDFKAYNYRVEYYYDGIIATDETIHGNSAVLGSTVSENAPLTKIKNSIEYNKVNEVNNPLVITSIVENNVIKIYYNSEYNITTKVLTHDEQYSDETKKANVKGGTISGDSENPYEKVFKGEANKKSIVISPANEDGKVDYEIALVTINGSTFDFKTIAQTNDKVTLDNNGILVIKEGFFEGIDESKHIEVEFRKKSKVIVKYLEEETGKVLYKTPDDKDFIEITGLEGDKYTTEHKIISGYKDSSLGITDEDGINIAEHSRVQIKANSAEGSMYANEFTIIYWYKKNESKVTERHIEINEKGESTELASKEYNGYVLDKQKTYRGDFGENYIPVDGPESPSESVTVARKDEISKEVTITEEGTKEVWYYYEKQFNVVTGIKSHTETVIDVSTGEEKTIKVEGGTISKEYKKDENGEYILDEYNNKIEVPYEMVLNRGDSKKKIVIKPDDLYRIKSISINDSVISLEGLDKAEDGSITLPEAYFKDVQEDKYIVVEFEKIPAKVIVKYVDIVTGKEILEEKVIEGYVADDYDEPRVDVEGYAPSEPEPENSKGKLSSEPIIVTYYYDREFKITTEVRTHEEDENSNKKQSIEGTQAEHNDAGQNQALSENKKVQVKGGTITGELTDKNKLPIELVLRGKGNTKEIVMKPDEGYRFKLITIYEYFAKTTGNNSEGDTSTQTENSDVNQNDMATSADDINNKRTTTENESKFINKYNRKYEISTQELMQQDGTVVIPSSYFTNMQSDKHIVVEYERIPSKVIVNYLEKTTEKTVAKQEIGQGWVGYEYTTHEKEIPYYELLKDELPDNSEGVFSENDTIVNYWYRKLLFNLKVTKKFTSVKINGRECLDDKSDFVKVSIANTKLDNTTIEVKYIVAVTNTGEIAGTAKVVEQIPVGFKASKEMLKKWSLVDGNYEITTGEIQPGETVEYEVILNWDTNMKNVGRFKNIARIENVKNVPEFEEYNLVDNEDSCVMLIEIRTGDSKENKHTNAILGTFVISMCAIIYIGNKIYHKRINK